MKTGNFEQRQRRRKAELSCPCPAFNLRFQKQGVGLEIGALSSYKSVTSPVHACRTIYHQTHALVGKEELTTPRVSPRPLSKTTIREPTNAPPSAHTPSTFQDLARPIKGRQRKPGARDLNPAPLNKNKKEKKNTSTVISSQRVNNDDHPSTHPKTERTFFAVLPPRRARSLPHSPPASGADSSEGEGGEGEEVRYACAVQTGKI